MDILKQQISSIVNCLMRISTLYSSYDHDQFALVIHFSYVRNHNTRNANNLFMSRYDRSKTIIVVHYNGVKILNTLPLVCRPMFLFQPSNHELKTYTSRL